MPIAKASEKYFRLESEKYAFQETSLAQLEFFNSLYMYEVLIRFFASAS